MKIDKARLAFILIILNTFVTLAQEQRLRKFSYGVNIEQLFFLNEWHDSKYKNVLENPIANIDIRINYHLNNKIGFWTQTSIILKKKDQRLPNGINVFDEINLDDYYIIDNMTSPSDYNREPTMGFGFGFSYTKKIGAWSLSPNLGIGVDIFNNENKQSYSIKEKGTNNAYKIEYYLYNDEYSDTVDLAKVIFQLKASRKLWKRANIDFGISYNQYLERTNLAATMHNYYDSEFIKKNVYKGNFASTLGLSIGISFRFAKQKKTTI